MLLSVQGHSPTAASVVETSTSGTAPAPLEGSVEADQDVGPSTRLSLSSASSASLPLHDDGSSGAGGVVSVGGGEGGGGEGEGGGGSPHRPDVSSGTRPVRAETRKYQRSHNTVRVFLSSTFRDFQLERDFLFHNIFPELEMELRHRGLFFAPVDLRWGVTAQDSSAGNVIKLCLEEIDHCAPFFIGMLGDRYGWHQVGTGTGGGGGGGGK